MSWLTLKTEISAEYTVTYIRGIRMAHNIHVSMYLLTSCKWWAVYYTHHDNVATKHYVNFTVCTEHWNYWQICYTDHMYKNQTA